MVGSSGVCILCSGSTEGRAWSKQYDEGRSDLKRAVNVVLRIQLEDHNQVCSSCAENVIALEQRMGR